MTSEARRSRPVLLVEDGTLGGIQRAGDYLVQGMEDLPGAPRVERLALRGRGSLAASSFVFARALGALTWRLATRRYRLLHVNMTQRGSTFRAFFVVLLAWLARTPVVLHLHSSEYRAFVESLPLPAVALVRWMFHRAARVVVLGDVWAGYTRAALRLPADRVEVIRNAVPGPDFLPPRSGAGEVHILFLGQVGVRKGAGDLIDALGSPEVAGLRWRATFAGDGDVEPYRRRTSCLGLDRRVRFTGWVDQDAVRAELKAADVMVLPSYAEGLPLSVLEALAHGLTVISTPVGAIAEVIEDGVTGLLVQAGDVDGLARALERVISDGALRARLGAAGRERWGREHALAPHARRLVALYDEVAPVRVRERLAAAR